MAPPERVVAGLSTSSSSSMNARMTSLDSSLSPELMQSFSFSSSLLLSLPPLLSSSLSLLSLSDKGSFSASPQRFLSILFVADQFLQDSFGEASVRLGASLDHILHAAFAVKPFRNAAGKRIITTWLNPEVRDEVYCFLYPEEYALPEKNESDSTHSSTSDEEELEED